jgi:RNA polymerase sigma-70 factor, ECF subfamily
MDAQPAPIRVDDDNLVLLAQNSDRRAFALLVERHYAMVYSCAYRRLGNRGDAEDLAQNVMVKFGRAIFTLKEPAALRGFLLRLTINAVTDHFRNRRREVLGAFRFFSDPTTTLSAAHAEDQLGALWSAVKSLPAQQRDAVLLVYADGASHREASEAMGCSEATVSYHVHAARKRLKQMLKEGAS